MPAEPSRSAASSRRRKSVRVWGEVGLTIAISTDPPQYVKVTFGHERIAPSGTLEDIKRTTEQVRAYNEEEVERQVDHYRRLIEAGDSEPAPRRRR